MSRRVSAAVAVLAAALAASACSGSTADVGSGEQGDLDPLALLAAAAEASAGRSVRGELTTGGALNEQLADIAPVTSFEVDHGGNVAVDVVSDISGAALDGDGVPDREALSNSLDFRARYVDGLVYIDFPAAFGLEVTEDRPWLVGDGQAGVLGNVVVTLCPTPLASLGALPVTRLKSGRTDCNPVSDSMILNEWATEAEIVGHQEVRGADTTRVRYVVLLGGLVTDSFQAAQGRTLSDLPDAADYDDDWATPELDESGEPLWDPLGIGLGATEVNVWIDGDQLVRRVVLDLSWMFGTDGDIPGFEDAEGPLLQSIVEFYDFDADITVEAPPPESVAGDLGDLAVPGAFG